MQTPALLPDHRASTTASPMPTAPAKRNFGDIQLEIYFRGLEGVRESLPLTFQELERRAHAALPEGIVSYVAGGAGNEHTQQANVSGLRRLRCDPADARPRAASGTCRSSCSGCHCPRR